MARRTCPTSRRSRTAAAGMRSTISEANGTTTRRSPRSSQRWKSCQGLVSTCTAERFRPSTCATLLKTLRVCSAESSISSESIRVSFSGCILLLVVVTRNATGPSSRWLSPRVRCRLSARSSDGDGLRSLARAKGNLGSPARRLRSLRPSREFCGQSRPHDKSRTFH